MVEPANGCPASASGLVESHESAAHLMKHGMVKKGWMLGPSSVVVHGRMKT